MARSWQFATLDSWREPYLTGRGLNLLELIMSADLSDEELLPIPSNSPYQRTHHQDDRRPPTPRTDPSSPAETPFPHAFPDAWQA